MTALRRLRHAFVALAALALLAVGVTDAHATHFRYGTLRWEVIPTNPPNPAQTRIKVTAETAWRYSFAWPNGQVPTLNVPLTTAYSLQVETCCAVPGTSVAPSQTLRVTPTFINGPGGEDWFVGTSQAEFQFDTARLPVRIYFDNAARVSNLQDTNNDNNFRVEARMSATPNAASPAASILPIITVGFPNPAAHFFVPAADVENDPLTWSIAPTCGTNCATSRSKLTKARPDGADDVPNPINFDIDPVTGEVTWATDQELTPPVNGSLYYSVQFIVTDSKGGETPVDALLRLRQVVPNPPVVEINGSQSQHVVAVRPGNEASFTVTGIDNDPGATVTLTSGNLPPGATMSPSLPTAGSSPRSSVFKWTPTLAQAGNSYTVVFAATDEFGNQDTNSAVITVLVNFPPVPTCPAPLTVEADGPGGASNVTLTASVFDQDPDPLTVKWYIDGALVETDTVPAGPGPTQGQVSMTSNYPFLPSPHAIKVEVSDGQATRECTSPVTVVDTHGPVLHLPASQTLEATGPGGAVATWSPDPPLADDIVDGPVAVTCNHASGETFPIFAPGPVTTVTCSATDSHGNTSTGSFSITVVDTTPPVISNMPANMVVEATGPTGAPASWPPPTATDLVDGSVNVVCTPASGSNFLLDVTTTVSCTATDSHGNTSAPSTFTVQVVDTTPPVISNMPANMTVEATGPTGAPASWPPPTATDIVDGSVNVVCTPASGSNFLLDVTTTVSCTATDAHGNTSPASTFTVTVVDTTPPVISNMPANMTVEATGPTGAPASWPPPTASDIVDGSVNVVCTPASGSNFLLDVTTTVSCTATDAHGNTSPASTFTVKVVDTTPPVISNMPANMIVEATGPAGAPASWPPPTATDIVDGSVNVVCTPASGSTFPLDVITTVSCTATDAHSNSSTRTFTVKVQDTTPPDITVPANMTVSATGPNGAIVAFVATAVDLVDGPVPVTCVPPSGSLFPLGTTTVTCSAHDAHNNPASKSFTITVVDDTPPPVVVTLRPGVLWPPNHKMVQIDVRVQTEPGATCSIVNVTSNEPVEGRGDGTTPFDWVFRDMNLQLRAERSGTGTGRVYTVTVRCVDAAGNVGFGTATAICPHDMGGGSAPGVK